MGVLSAARSWWVAYRSAMDRVITVARRRGKVIPGVSTGTSLMESLGDDNRDSGGAKRSGKVRGFPYGFILFLFLGN